MPDPSSTEEVATLPTPLAPPGPKNHPTSTLPKASVIIVNTNERHHLERCLPSIFAQDYPDFEVCVVDNASTDGSAEYVEQVFPQATVIRNPQNLGYTGANNIGFKHTTGTYIAILNPDTMVDAGWMKKLVEVLECDPEAGIATPRILMLRDPKTINTCGNEMHFTGLTLCRGLGQHRDAYSVVEEVSAVSGAAFVVRRELFAALGGFDESLFLYMEDTDLSLRLRLAGYRCLYVPASIVYHDYALRFGARKAFYQERNRYLMLLKALRWRTWLVLLPALLLAELVTWGFVFIKQPRQLGNKLRACLWIARNWSQVMESRRRTQILRQVQDRELLATCASRLAYEQFDRGSLALVARVALDPLFVLLHKLALVLVRW